MLRFAHVRILLLATALVLAYLSGTAGAQSSCIPNGGVDDTLYNTHCCSGYAVPGSTWCYNPADWGTTWASCYQICGAPPGSGGGGGGGEECPECPECFQCPSPI